MALIYIVEDDESIREIETIALKNSNYIVSAFENAKEFYKKLDELVPDLILLDVMLPDESGYDIVRKLRKRPATQDIPIIMVTAKTTEMDMIKGFDGFTVILDCEGKQYLVYKHAISTIIPAKQISILDSEQMV